jgi:hypothetical protein
MWSSHRAELDSMRGPAALPRSGERASLLGFRRHPCRRATTSRRQPPSATSMGGARTTLKRSEEHESPAQVQDPALTVSTSMPEDPKINASDGGDSESASRITPISNIQPVGWRFVGFSALAGLRTGPHPIAEGFRFIAGLGSSPLYIHPHFLLAFTSRPPVADGLGVTVVVAPNDWFARHDKETRGETDARRH